MNKTKYVVIHTETMSNDGGTLVNTKLWPLYYSFKAVLTDDDGVETHVPLYSDNMKYFNYSKMYDDTIERLITLAMEESVDKFKADYKYVL